jgi:protein SCO1
MEQTSSPPLALEPSLGRRAQAFAAGLVGRPLFWALFIAVGLSIPIARTLSIRLPPPLPVLGHVPAFSFTDQYGKPFGSPQLDGKVWVANFIFTRCPSICPLFTQRMSEIQHRARGLGEYFHLVSFSVDPEYDKPDVLLGYAKQHKASPRMWTFLTGDREPLRRTLVEGLHVQMTKEGADDDLMSIGHGGHFVLIDAKMQIRGYYDSSEPGAVDTVLRDAGLLANRGY